MFGFLKKKLSEVVDSISGKVKKKTEEQEEQQQKIERTEQISPETFQEEIKTEVEEKVPEPEIEEIGPEPILKKEIETELAKTPRTELEKKPEKKSFFRKITEKVVKKVTEKKMSAEDVDPMLIDLKGSLIEADVAVEVAEKIANDLRSALVDREIKRGKEKEMIVDAFRKSLLDVLDVPKIGFESMLKNKRPSLIVFWGFNGAGKTTSLAKMAKWLMKKGHTCVFAAGDTFRAGAEEQIGIHAEKVGTKLIKHQYGADPAAVIFDAVEHAKAKDLDFVLADTAGRAHTNANLMDQMKKIVRVNKPDLKILVIDSLTGNDAVLQARMYGEIGVDAVIFTKVDVNEKGGAILSVTHELKKPILFLGMGQDYSHLEEFDARKFVDRILAE